MDKYRIESDLLGELRVPSEAYYGVPDALKQACIDRLPKDILEVLRRFEARVER